MGFFDRIQQQYRRWAPPEPPGTTDLAVPTPDGPAYGRFTAAERPRGAVIMVGGSRGGLWGPAGVYAPLAARLQEADVAALRLHYRQPNLLQPCIADVLAAVDTLAERGIVRCALIGWSFGGAVVIAAGAASEAVVGVATVAGQTYGAEAVSRLTPRAFLAVHGTADRVLSVRCAHSLYASAGEPKELVLYPGDNHGLTHHANQLHDKLQDWVLAVLAGSTGAEHTPVRTPSAIRG